MHERKKTHGQRKDKKMERMREDVANRKMMASPKHPHDEQMIRMADAAQAPRPR